MRFPRLAILVVSVPFFPGLCLTVQRTPPPAGATPKEIALSGASVLFAVGDIADCSYTGARETALLVDSVLKADSVAKVNDTVITLGDNAYPIGSTQNFKDCFTPTWGDPGKRIMKNIHPVPGNHEHETEVAAPYYIYFGDKAGDPKKGYYSFDFAGWHMVGLNSALLTEPQFTAFDQSAQEDWLRADLKSHASTKCTLVYWHHPRFSSGYHGDDPRLQSIWQILFDNNVDLVLNGHDHDYERFLPMDPASKLDTLRGITQIVVGTGGGILRGFRASAAVNSVNRIEGYFGVLKLSLSKDEFRWAFLDTVGHIWDPGGGKCH